MLLVCCVKVIPWWCSQFNFLFLSLSPFFFFIFFYLLCRVVPPWGSGPVFSSTYSSFFFKYREVPKRSVLFPCISLLFLSKRYMYMKKKLWENYEKKIYIYMKISCYSVFVVMTVVGYVLMASSYYTTSKLRINRKPKPNKNLTDIYQM